MSLMPVLFYCSKTHNDSSKIIKRFLKSVYDTVVPNQKQGSGILTSLPVLSVDNFDLEQIWQQLELHHEESVRKSLMNVSLLCSKKNKLIFSEFENINVPQNNSDSSDIQENANGSNADLEDNTFIPENKIATDNKEERNVESGDEGNNSQISDSEEELERNPSIKHSRSTHSVIDDDFFKLNEMEKFLAQEENKPSHNYKHSDLESDSELEEGSVDLFNDLDKVSEDDVTDTLKNVKYDDFFGNQPEKKSKFTELSSQNFGVEDENDNIKSTYELRKERLEKKIKRLEEQTISEKPWQLKGEISSENRPQNSLLEKVLDFDLTARPGRYFITVKPRYKRLMWAGSPYTCESPLFENVHS